MTLRLGVDIACRAAHQASLADGQGQFVWCGHRFRTTPADLEQLWSKLPAGHDPADVVVVMEPTRNAWVPLAAWFRRRGARVVLVPPERSADLRNYYAKHTKTDRLDSQLLARLPMLHPDGLHLEDSIGPGGALKRAAKLHSSLTHRRSQNLARLDALLEILGPGWHDAIGTELGSRTALKFLAAGYADPHVVKRLGRTRLTRFCHRHSRGAWGEPLADAVLSAAAETLQLWDEGALDYPDLAEDIAIEARLALQLTEEIKDLDERTALLVQHADPTGILASAPGVGAVTAAAILGRLGNPNRFTSLAGARAFTGLVPALDASGLSGRHGGPTKRGDAVLRQALFMAAGQARRIDPTLAAKYQRLMVDAGKHHNSALCHISTTLLTRIIACWRAGQPYQLRDVDGTPVTTDQARAIITERYAIPKDLRARRRTTTRTGTDRRDKESLGAPSTGPSTTDATTVGAA
ncbi:MAG: IS110 family transposase [Actinomycetota bacterium]|nr:IS110 family transposase [Actinomycetota bacterium]